ncbi:hypothetical protein INT45_010233 [Circinella minor]|uniref:CCHC-type domain-containing protein n=1 Tax=Circinella minor TaxID=1195481 RepID=A0A8H7RPW1_9FUNG|nr:hypothetical protein INT45_010233 [Circinella minor]
MEQQTIMTMLQSPTAHTDDQQSLAKIIRPRQLDTFHGERTVQQVEAWLYSLEKYTEFVNIDNYQMVLFAVTLLRDGSVEQYVREFHSLMLELPDMDIKDALFNFVQGLKYQCRLQVLMQKPFSLSEAYAYAEAYETAEQCAKVSNRHPSNFSPFNKSFGQSSPSFGNQGPTPIDLNVIKPANRHYGGSSGGGSYGSRSNDGINWVKCFKCGEHGHIHHDCKSRRQENRHGKQDFRPMHN